jgi:hypothetical protein
VFLVGSVNGTPVYEATTILTGAVTVRNLTIDCPASLLSVGIQVEGGSIHLQNVSVTDCTPIEVSSIPAYPPSVTGDHLTVTGAGSGMWLYGVSASIRDSVLTGNHRHRIRGIQNQPL